MIRYEFKKILKNKFIIVFLIIFFACDIFFIYKNEYQRISEKKSLSFSKAEDNYNYVKGIMTNEKFDYAKSINPEDLIYGGSELYKDMVRALGYKENARKICSRAKENMEFYKSIGCESQRYKNERIYEAFSGREINEYYRHDGVDSYLTYDYSTLMAVIIIMLTVFHLFFNDKNTGMYRIVKTSRHGQRYIRLVRTLAAVVTGIAVMCLFRLTEYIEYYIIYQFDGLHMPLYSVEEYAQTLYNGSIGAFFITDIALKCMGVILFTLIAIACVNIIKEQNTAIGIFAGIYFLSIYVSLKSEAMYTPIRLFDGYSIIKSTEFINIGGFCMSGMVYTLLISAFISAAMLCISMIRGRW